MQVRVNGSLSKRLSMRFVCSAVFVVLLGSASAVQAEGYGPAGCGLGSVVIGSGHGFSQVFASTTNGTSASQTFGITSGTSNCDNHGGGSDHAKAFIETNREALSKDMARAAGETIVTLSTIAGCADAGSVGSALQSQFRTLVPGVHTSDAAVAERVVDLLRSDSTLVCLDLS